MNDYPCGGTRREQELMLYVGGELLPWDRLRIESHLRHCPLCREQQRLMLRTMQSIAAEVRGGSLPQWQAQGLMVSASALSGRFHGKPPASARLVTLAAISAAVAVLTSYMAATYGDHLLSSRSAPLSHVSTATTAATAATAASPPCLTPAPTATKSCHNCASPAPNVTPP
jgi:anti-sigma factor RsiW